jgi:prepilin-type N-terminal cleavage/methylation domain-containing protein
MKVEKRGFTLAELLVVIALMAVMATVALSSFTKSQKKGRDARRKQDLSEIRKALELYNQDNNEYPPTLNSPLEHPTTEGVVYMVKVPSDPKSGYSYIYDGEVDDGQGFRLHARLEYDKDSDINCPDGSGEDCGVVNCNYVVTSPGTSLPAGCE